MFYFYFIFVVACPPVGCINVEMILMMILNQQEAHQRVRSSGTLNLKVAIAAVRNSFEICFEAFQTSLINDQFDCSLRIAREVAKIRNSYVAIFKSIDSVFRLTPINGGFLVDINKSLIPWQRYSFNAIGKSETTAELFDYAGMTRFTHLTAANRISVFIFGHVRVAISR